MNAAPAHPSLPARARKRAMARAGRRHRADALRALKAAYRAVGRKLAALAIRHDWTAKQQSEAWDFACEQLNHESSAAMDRAILADLHAAIACAASATARVVVAEAIARERERAAWATAAHAVPRPCLTDAERASAEALTHQA